MGVESLVFHPCKGDGDAVAIFLAIGVLLGGEGIALAYGAVFELFVFGENGVEDVLVFVGRAYLDAHRLAVGGERAALTVEPVVGFACRTLVAEREYLHVLPQSVALAISYELVYARFEGLCKLDFGVRFHGLRLASVEAVAHHSVYFAARSVVEREAEGGQLLVELFRGKVAREHFVPGAEGH